MGPDGRGAETWDDRRRGEEASAAHVEAQSLAAEHRRKVDGGTEERAAEARAAPRVVDDNIFQVTDEPARVERPPLDAQREAANLRCVAMARQSGGDSTRCGAADGEGRVTRRDCLRSLHHVPSGGGVGITTGTRGQAPIAGTATPP